MEPKFVFAAVNRNSLAQMGDLWTQCRTRAFARAARKAQLTHIWLHDLRHTHATLMLKAGVHPKVVSERLGHTNIGITLDTYSHGLPGLQEAAAERFWEQ